MNRIFSNLYLSKPSFNTPFFNKKFLITLSAVGTLSALSGIIGLATQKEFKADWFHSKEFTIPSILFGILFNIPGMIICLRQHFLSQEDYAVPIQMTTVFHEQVKVLPHYDAENINFSEGTCSLGIWQRNTTCYEGKEIPKEIEKGMIDFSYVDDSGFALVLDGCGHNNPLMQPVLQAALERFIPYVRENISTFSSLEEAKRFAAAAPYLLSCTLMESNAVVYKGCSFKEIPGHLPAMSFVLLYGDGAEKYVILNQYDDTMIALARKGVLYPVYSPSKSCSINHRTPRLQIIKAQAGDVIMGFSDGIGEFLVWAEIEEVFFSCKDPCSLLQEFKSKILKIGAEEKKHNEEIEAANGKLLKYHDFNDARHYDDISLFVLNIIPIPLQELDLDNAKAPAIE